MSPAQESEAPLPPAELLAGIGPGDWVETGKLTVALLEELVGVRASDRVLDVGCGLGRIAWPLARKLGEAGSYTGFDVVKAYTDWCSANLGLPRERFRFEHVDVRTSMYNPGGAVAAREFVFPWPDSAFDLSIATSLFTHLLPEEGRAYLREIGRTLAPGGRLFASFYLLDERGREAAATLATDPTFPVPIERGFLHDAAVPAMAVACDADFVLEALGASGLEATAIRPGRWKGREGPYHQDLVAAVRRR